MARIWDAIRVKTTQDVMYGTKKLFLEATIFVWLCCLGERAIFSHLLSVTVTRGNVPEFMYAEQGG